MATEDPVPPSDWSPELGQLVKVTENLTAVVARLDRLIAVWEELAARLRGPLPQGVIATPRPEVRAGD